MTTQWEKMTPEQRLTAATVDIMQHKEFALLSGVVMMGKVLVVETLEDEIFKQIGEIPEPKPLTFTAATNGLDCLYGRNFMALQDRAQHRWIVLHENFHKAFHHCVDYKDIVEKYPEPSNQAQDFVINAMIDVMDPDQKFAKRPEGVNILYHEKYTKPDVWDWITVLRDLLKNGMPKMPKGGGQGQGMGTVFDIHIQNPNAGKSTQEQAAAAEKLKQQVQDALYQGKMTVERMAGKGGGNSALDALTKDRVTDWKTPLREFIEQICSGYDNSRFCPPNKRFLPLGILMPSHFSATTGEIHVYCDTSGSMGGIYPVVFGEIARIADHVKPKALRVIWWDGEVQGEQVFTETDYDKIASLMKPTGGGGTTPQVVVTYVKEKGYKPKAGIWLTDGYLDGSDAVMPHPVLWGVVDNEGFVPPQGKKINITSAL
jgi:predicted metal-dependent peptidase